MATSDAVLVEPGAGALDRQAPVAVCGDRTLIGGAIARQLARHGFTRVLGGPADLTDRRAVDAWFLEHQPTYVFLAAGLSGGIGLNQARPADLLLDNLLVECHVIDAARRSRVERLLYLASSCSYPKHAPQPLREESLLTGPLEPTSAAYATAKIAGIAFCEACRRQDGRWFQPAVPADAFGPGDDFSPEGSHVVPALIRKMHDAKRVGASSVDVWGTGTPRREFIFADDLAEACLWVMERSADPSLINLGGGTDLSIRELALAVRQAVGYDGELHFDPARPDGMPLKALDASRLRGLGWRPATPLQDALKRTYDWFLKQE